MFKMYSSNPSENLGDLEQALDSQDSTPHASTFNLAALATRSDGQSGEHPHPSQYGSLLNRIDSIDGGQLLDRLDGLASQSAASLSPRSATSGFPRPKISSPKQPRSRRSRSPARSDAGLTYGNNESEGYPSFLAEYRSRSASASEPSSTSISALGPASASNPHHQSRTAPQAASRQGNADSLATQIATSMTDSIAYLSINQGQDNYTTSQGSGSSNNNNYSSNYRSNRDDDNDASKPKLKMLTIHVTGACRNALAANDWAELDKIRGECNSKIYLESAEGGFYKATIVSNTTEKAHLGWKLLIEFNEDYAFDL